MVDAVILAAGMGKRMDAGMNKMFLKLYEKEILYHTVKKFFSSDVIDKIIVVAKKDELDFCKRICSVFMSRTKFVLGGKTRQESSYLGVCASDADFLLIHDGARPFITHEDIVAAAENTVRYGAAAVGCKCVDTLKRTADGFITETVDREEIIKIYTPQGFKRSLIKELHERAFEDKISVTDDSSICEHYGVRVKFVEGSPLNIKITSKADMLLAKALLGKTEDLCLE